MSFIAGIGVVHCGRSSAHLAFDDLIFEATSKALADAGLTRADIDGVCLAAADQLDARAISSMQAAGPAGAFQRDEIRVSDDGTLALAAAALRIDAGVSKRLVVASWTKSSESPPLAAEGVNPEPTFMRSVGLHPLVGEAALTTAYVSRHRVDLDAVDELAHSLAPDGEQLPDEFLAYPLRTSHLPPPTDGAIAMVVTREPTDVAVGGIAWGADDANSTRRSRAAEEAVAAMAGSACEQAGVKLTPELMVEATDRTVFRLCLAAAGLGLTSAQEAPTEILGGACPNLNRSGGLWKTNPIFAAGLERVVEAARHVKEGAGAALALSSYGYAGQGQFAAVVTEAAA